VKIADVPVLPS